MVNVLEDVDHDSAQQITSLPPTSNSGVLDSAISTSARGVIGAGRAASFFGSGDYYMVAIPEQVELNRRQAAAASYVAVNGTTSNDCTSAPLYRINNGSLSTTSNGVTYIYSTSPGVGSQLFLPTTTAGEINTAFSMGARGTVSWLNAAFYGGQAQFCAVANGGVYAVFSQYAYPSGCIIVQLTLFSASSCISLQDQINDLSDAIASIQLNTFTVVSVRPTTIVQRIVSTLERIIVSTPPAVTNTPPAQTQTATRIITATTSIRAMLPAPSQCGNQGMQYAIFGNNQPGHVNQVYSAYNPTYLKARGSPGSDSTWTTLYYNSTVSGIGGYTYNCPDGAAQRLLYTGAPSTVPCHNWSGDYRGYFYVYQTGSWSFIASGVDDAFIMWLGPLAQQGWTKANANLSLAFSYTTGTPTSTFTVNLEAGTYLPMRIVHGQAVGGYGYQLTIQDPNGIVAQNSASQGSGYVVQYSCDRTTAPPYAYAFGQEQ
ncbi:Putative PA14/GLEYA domain-containing protein [Septoria linicola]|uniref:PA14/GLEYA domain-containing protein n=1 Tax=Septoria linicola TaxID=215465 RepID=A0A9Q9B1K2_9PEZI|nr:putative PA14/GLEYA domain-containing protein [Septoria linicola]USW58970.1 Putative PA14/GLEYA domain-containing protein [Septoria linicola]